MRWSKPGRQAARRTAGAILVALALGACSGGGGGDGGAMSTGSAAPTSSAAGGSASGTVTGFGSVFVEGVEIQDVNATTRAENPDGSFSNIPVKLGQRVRVALDGSGNAATITVDAAIMGAVTSGGIDASSLSFTVAAQRVRANADPAAGPVTAYGGGYTGFADIAAGDLVEVHGSTVFDSTAAAYVVHATRVEKRPSITAVRVMGKVAGLNSTAKTFTINGLTVSYGSAQVVPASATLANDQTVAIWGPQNSLSSSGGTLTLAASRVRIMNASLGDDVASGTTTLGGLVSNAAAGTFEIQGVKVTVGSATISPPGATVANGSYVQVSGTVGSDGSIAATSIRVRQANTTDASAVVRLIGAIDSLTDQKSFVVRDTPVDASRIDLANACPNVTLAVGTFLNITATLQNGTDVVLATSMSCPSAPPFAMRGVRGSVSNVDATASTFTLTATGTGKVQKVQWNDKTIFAGVTSSTLDSATLVVEGYLDAAGTLVARMIRNPAALAGQMDADAYSGLLSGTGRSWDIYRAGHR